MKNMLTLLGAWLRADFMSTASVNLDPLVQVDHVRVVDLDIGASKSDNQLLLGLNDNGLRDARSGCAECEKKRDDFKGRANPAKVRDRSVSQHD
jgi:hypothetical protein